MGWQEFPWQEPEGEGGLATSRSYSTYNWLLHVALAADTANPPYKLEDGIICECKSQLFPQLLDRDLYRNIYVPFDLPGEIVHGDSSVGISFSVGSAVRLGQELDKITPFIEETFINKVFDMEHYPADYFERIDDLVKILKIGVADSLRLNLPLQVSW